jgi:hypothetical protein
MSAEEKFSAVVVMSSVSSNCKSLGKVQGSNLVGCINIQKIQQIRKLMNFSWLY